MAVNDTVSFRHLFCFLSLDQPPPALGEDTQQSSQLCALLTRLTQARAAVRRTETEKARFSSGR